MPIQIDKPVIITSREGLDTPVQYLKGVGPQRAEALKKLEILTIENLIFYFPREHQDRKQISIAQTQPGLKAAIKAEVLSIEFQQVGRSLGQARALLRDATGTMQAIWFKRLSYRYDVFANIRKNITATSWVECYGSVEWGPEGKVLRVDDFEMDPSDEKSQIVPRYSVTNEIQEKWLRQLILRAVRLHAEKIIDPLPQSICAQQKLLGLSEAIQQYHSPRNWTERDKARERLAFDELFFLELALELNRQNRDQISKGFAHQLTRKLLTPFKNKLGYDFTKAQSRAINEIFKDMGSTKPMNRLLQGDVGSGKTIVALSSALLSIENDRQVVFLAPTEILAEQHALTISKLFQNLSVRVELLTGSTSKPNRQKYLDQLKKGKINLIVGTHALLQEDIEFAQLGLVIIDEQHRFGVQQRAKLTKKSNSIFKVDPDVLIMTATPIPRTLAMTIYGDLDVSTIDEMPPGRSPIKTWIGSEQDAIKRIQTNTSENRQAYVVFPLVNESEKLTRRSGQLVRAAKAEFEKLQNFFNDKKMLLLHGQIKSEEKKTIMDQFRNGNASILVATPVIEVGVDVPNATIIAIYNPERFGLAQLHQLRGRVGRGKHASECILVVDEMQERAKTRLETFCSILDGFALAEEDLKLRGPGELLGEAQHGVPFFRVANLVKDNWLILRSRESAGNLVKGETSLTMKEYRVLNQVLNRRFGHKLNLSQIG